MLTNEVKFYVTRTIDMNGTTEKVFLEYLVQGIKDLYFYPKDNGYYYIEDENGKMIAVTKESEKIEGNKYVTDKKYIGLLNYAFRDAESVTKGLDKKDFNRATMIELTKEYHDKMCTSGEKCIVFTNDYKQKFIKLNFAVYGGLQLTDYSYKYTKVNLLNSKKSLTPAVGGLLNINSPRFMKSMSVVIDASLARLEGDGSFSNGSDYYERYTFSSLASTLSVGVKYTHSERKFRPTIEVGIGYSNIFNNSNTLYIGYNKYTYKNIYNMVSNYFTLSCGIGMDYQLNAKHQIFCKLLYNKMNDLDGNISGIQLKVGYTL
ncbi:hypothetical protein BSYN_11050 [Bacteroides sedimenti]|uniref:Outer membrane protein beta-barrel domain-containing protein n=2 Tax=Bacteroides sedimenti TaxID=2136147 RepID=A0ABM8IG04_9BACE